jgi:hypothetical protein
VCVKVPNPIFQTNSCYIRSVSWIVPITAIQCAISLTDIKFHIYPFQWQKKLYNNVFELLYAISMLLELYFNFFLFGLFGRSYDSQHLKHILLVYILAPLQHPPFVILDFLFANVHLARSRICPRSELGLRVTLNCAIQTTQVITDLKIVSLRSSHSMALFFFVPYD